jgi:uncharacterized protein YlxW (UPF0749 family)
MRALHTTLRDRASVVVMTPQPHGHTHEHRAPRRKWRLGTPLVFGLSGALFMVSATNSEGTDLRPGRTTDLAALVRVESRHVGELEARARQLTSDVDRLSRALDDEQVRRAQARADAARGPAGLRPVRGAGVTVTLSDAPRELRTPDQDINQLVVHQQDIAAVVNAMWDAGARAVTVQGRRVISTTAFKCAGSSVEINGRYYPQPYRISAIGVPDEIEARIDADRYVSGYRRDAADEDIQIGWDIEQDEDLEAPAFDGLLDLEYARPASNPE